MELKPPAKVLVIGSGPIIIGQAAEFDYAGTQACKALREEGVMSILVNSNPATIMTDDGIADAVYIEPLIPEVIERIIIKEKPDGLLPTLGGQTGLNLAVELASQGILDRHNVRLLGTPLESIKQAEDRGLFSNLLGSIGEPSPPSATVTTLQEAHAAATTIGLPLVSRPAFTLGGTGGGIIRSWNELDEIVQRGLTSSPINQILLERCLEGWKEIEYEVIRDSNDTCIVVCNMENLDPMGVHTGDSMVVAPSQTLSDKEYQMLRSASLKIIRSLGIEGGCNVQFALAPHPMVSASLPDAVRPKDSMEYYVIEVNPRVSRSSALASKATGYPIARVAAKIAIGRRLDEIANAVTQTTKAAFEPALDYCVVKIPRWPFDKFPNGDRNLGTQMKATGEVMAIDRTFESALQKAVRSLELTNNSLLWEDPSWQDIEVWDDLPLSPSHDLKIWTLLAALRRGATPDQLSRTTQMDPWFLYAMGRIVQMEADLLATAQHSREQIWRAKRMGFSDVQLASLGVADGLPERVRNLRKEWGISPVYKMVDTCAAEFEAFTPYYYSTYEQENEALPLPGPKAIVVGSGPIRIGQGIEFDYCSVQAAWALRSHGLASIIVNSNPETVSTDFDTSERLYFEPLDDESLRDIIDNETSATSSIDPPPTVVQFGGQTAINLSQTLDRVGLPILGSSAQSIDIASDRKRFEELMSKLGIPQPPGAAVSSATEAIGIAETIGYPVLARPSYVLGGRAMEILHTPDELKRYVKLGLQASPDKPILIDKYLQGKECEVDAISDGTGVLIPGIMEHVERAGVHSGDSLAIYPCITLTSEEEEKLVEYTTRIATGLQVRGLMNIQFVITSGTHYRTPASPPSKDSASIHVLEVNPRASRTIPFISKVTGVPMVELATGVMLGHTLSKMGYATGLYPRKNLVAVKAPVFSMSKLAGVDTYLGPEMKSTGEVMGIDRGFNAALVKALIASGMLLKPNGSVLLSIADSDKLESIPLIQALVDQGYKIFATEGTCAFMEGMGIPDVVNVKKIGEGTPDVVQIIEDGLVDAVVNTMSGGPQPVRDGFQIRRAAVERRIPCFTSLDTARISMDALGAGQPIYSVEHRSTYLQDL